MGTSGHPGPDTRKATQVTSSALRLEVVTDPEAFYEYSESENLGDGLPLVPPTEPRVDAMLATVDRAADDVVAVLDPRGGIGTVEAIAANAVMAGCRPDYFPAVLAAVEAAADPVFCLGEMSVNSNPITPLLVVNGPARDALGINYQSQCFGSAGRANATIGRALRLVMINIGGAIPSLVSKSVHGSPMRYTMCIGEWDERNPWAPQHVQRGFNASESCITALSANSFLEIGDIWSQTGDSYLSSIARSMRTTAGSWIIVGCSPMNIIINGNWADIMFRDGFTDLAEVKQVLWERSQVHLSEFSPEIQKALVEGTVKSPQGALDHNCILPGDMVPMTDSPDNFNIIVAGGAAGMHGIVCHGWAFERPSTRSFKLAAPA